MASVTVGGKNIPLVVAKHDRTLASMAPGQKYGPVINWPWLTGSTDPQFQANTVISTGANNGIFDVFWDGSTLYSQYNHNVFTHQGFSGYRDSLYWGVTDDNRTATDGQHLYTLFFRGGVVKKREMDGTILDNNLIKAPTNDYCHGIAVTENKICVSDYSGTIWIYDKTSLELVDTLSGAAIQAQDSEYNYINGLAWDGTDLYADTDHDRVIRLDGLSTTILGKINTPESSSYGICFIGGNLVTLGTNAIYIHDGFSNYAGPAKSSAATLPHVYTITAEVIGDRSGFHTEDYGSYALGTIDSNDLFLGSVVRAMFMYGTTGAFHIALEDIHSQGAWSRFELEGVFAGGQKTLLFEQQNASSYGGSTHTSWAFNGRLDHMIDGNEYIVRWI